MATITAVDVQPVRPVRYSREPPGERAILATEGVELHLGLMSIIPRPTTLRQLVSVDEAHLYELTVREYTVNQFIAIALALADGDIEEAKTLIDDICPPDQRDW